MSTPSTAKASPDSAGHSTVAIIGLILSALALLGWIVILAKIFSVPKEPPTGDPMGDLFIAPANGLAYLYQVLVGVVGLCIMGTLSLVGTLVSAVGYGQAREPRAAVGLALGVAGLLVGIVLVVWRLMAWDML
jgi:hypothetical protein